MNAKELYELGEQQFAKRSSLLMLWQEIAQNFYPERADFTFLRSLGTDFAADLMTSYPVLCRRDLGDQMGSMLRPKAKSWFHPSVRNKVVRDTETRQKLQEFEEIQRRAMYDRQAQFTRAAKEGDHDFATFGQCVVSVEMNYRHSSLLYRTHHLRDVTWVENEVGEIGGAWRHWKPMARDLQRLYPDTVHKNIAQMVEKDPFCEVQCVHMVIDAEMYTGDSVGGPKRGQQPRYLICYDQAHDTVLEAVPIWNRHYIIPRWQTVSGSPFAFSPATVAALPDARLIQAMTLTLLEAGEKIANPPMIATLEAVRSDINLYPGGVSWVDIEYDERMGEALRPINTDAKGMPIGVDMARDTRTMIMQAFFLNKLRPFLPTQDKEMTAYQAGQIVAQYIRDALPLFEPMEQEWNGAVCDETFDLLWRNGAFGSPRDWPRELMGADIGFTFESPLHDAIEQQKGQKFLEMKGMLAEAIALDPNAVYVGDVITALRDALIGIGAPARWQSTEGEFDAAVKRAQAAKQAEATLGRLVAGSEAAANLAAANKDNAAAAMPV